MRATAAGPVALPVLTGMSSGEAQGYVQSVATELAEGGPYLAGADELLVSDAEHHARGERVSDGRLSPRSTGCNGLAQIPALLRYVSYTDLWLLPLGHTALSGVVARFWKAVLAATTRGTATPEWVVSWQAKKEIERALQPCLRHVRLPQAAEVGGRDGWGCWCRAAVALRVGARLAARARPCTALVRSMQC